MTASSMTDLPFFATAWADPQTPPPVSPRTVDLTEPKQHPTGDVDWALVRGLTSEAADRFHNRTDELTGDTTEEKHRLGRAVILDLLTERVKENIAAGNRDQAWSDEELQPLAKAIFDSIFGLGRLQKYVDDEKIENIFVTGSRVRLRYADGSIRIAPPVSDSSAELIEQLRRAVRRSGDSAPFDEANPMLDLTLPSGDRLAATYATGSARVPKVVIRRHRMTDITLDDLVNPKQEDHSPMISAECADFLRVAVGLAGKSIVIAGDQNAGKTTFLRALGNEIDPEEHIATLETNFELHFDEMPNRHEEVTAWESQPGSGELRADGSVAGEITIDKILYHSFRYTVDRIIVGEVRGKEILAMFNAMQAGAGSLSTLHAKSARHAINRMVTCAMQAGSQITADYAYREIADNIDYILHIRKNRAGRRYVSEIIALDPGENDRPGTTTVFKTTHEGLTVADTPPPHVEDLYEWGLPSGIWSKERRSA